MSLSNVSDSHARSGLDRPGHGADPFHREGFRSALDRESTASSALGWLAGIPFFLLLMFFAQSSGDLNVRQRCLLGLFAASMPFCAAWVGSGRARSVGWRLWLLLGTGLALSLAVKGHNLQRPPALPAAISAIAVGSCGILSAALSRRADWTGIEAGLGWSVALLGLVSLALFHPVAMQNSLDGEVLRNAWGSLLDATLLILGVSLLSAHRKRYVWMAALLAAGCVVRLLWHHGGGGG